MSIDAGRMIVGACQIIRAGLVGRKLVRDIDKMFANPDLLRGSTIVTRTGLLAINIIDIIGTLTGKIQPTDGRVLKACEILLRSIDFPLGLSIEAKKVQQNPSAKHWIHLIEKGIVYPLVGIVRTSVEAQIYEEKHYLEQFKKDPNATRPVYNYDRYGPRVIGERPINPDECQRTIAEAEKWQLATSVAEVATGLGIGTGFYDQLAKQQVINYIVHHALRGQPPRPRPQPPLPPHIQRARRAVQAQQAAQVALQQPQPVVIPQSASQQAQPVVPPQPAPQSNLEERLADRIKSVVKSNLPQIIDKDIVFGKYICPITHEAIGTVAAEITPNGQSIYYEASAIQEWLAKHQTSPVTRNPLTLAEVQYPMDIQREIDAAIDYHMSALNPRIERCVNKYFMKQPDREDILQNPGNTKKDYSKAQIVRILDNLKGEQIASLSLSIAGDLTADYLKNITHSLRNSNIARLILIINEPSASEQLEIDQIVSSEPKLQLILKKDKPSPQPLAKSSTVKNGPIGFSNIQRSCFLNAAVQVIFNCKLIRQAIEEFDEDSKDVVIQNLKRLIQSKSAAEANDHLVAIRKEIYDDNNDQDAGECLSELLERLNWAPVRIETSNSNGTFPHEDSRIAVNIHGMKGLQEALDRHFEPNDSRETQKIINEPQIIFVQLTSANPQDNLDSFSYPDNSIVTLPCQGKNIKYRINGFIYHKNAHYTVDICNFRDPEGSQRWIHCDDSNITETVSKPENGAVVLALEKCDS